MPAVKTILVLGISGFTGVHFDAFADLEGLAATHRLVGADSVEPRQKLRAFGEFIRVDALNRADLTRVVEQVRPSHILNLVGSFTGTSFADFMNSNVEVARHVLDAALGLQGVVRKIVLIGSAAEYGRSTTNPVSEEAVTNPVSLYGLSKVFQTALARYYHAVHGIPIVVARTFNVEGEGISPALSVGSFQRQIRSASDGDVIRAGNIETMRDFLPIQTVVSLYWELMTRGRPGEIYNVCSGVPVTIRSVLERMIAASGKQLRIEKLESLTRANDIECIYGDRTRLDELLRTNAGDRE